MKLFPNWAPAMAGLALILKLNAWAPALVHADADDEGVVSPEGQAAEREDRRLIGIANDMQKKLEEEAIKGDNPDALAKKVSELTKFMKDKHIEGPGYYLTENKRLVIASQISEKTPEGEAVKGLTWTPGKRDPADINGVVKIVNGSKTIVWEEPVSSSK